MKQGLCCHPPAEASESQDTPRAVPLSFSGRITFVCSFKELLAWIIGRGKIPFLFRRFQQNKRGKKKQSYQTTDEKIMWYFSRPDTTKTQPGKGCALPRMGNQSWTWWWVLSTSLWKWRAHSRHSHSEKRGKSMHCVLWWRMTPAETFKQGHRLWAEEQHQGCPKNWALWNGSSVEMILYPHLRWNR